MILTTCHRKYKHLLERSVQFMKHPLLQHMESLGQSIFEWHMSIRFSAAGQWNISPGHFGSCDIISGRGKRYTQVKIIRVIIVIISGYEFDIKISDHILQL